MRTWVDQAVAVGQTVLRIALGSVLLAMAMKAGIRLAPQYHTAIALVWAFLFLGCVAEECAGGRRDGARQTFLIMPLGLWAIVSVFRLIVRLARFAYRPLGWVVGKLIDVIPWLLIRLVERGLAWHEQRRAEAALRADPDGAEIVELNRYRRGWK